ncbi:MAG: flagellar hook-associated protein FlgK, partial [Rhodomicrobium sp.]
MNGAAAGVSVASAQISVVSQNIANQSNTGASRKIANIVTINGLPTVASISRASNAALLSSLLSANSSQAQQSAISNALTQLQNTLGTSSSDTNSPTALIGQLSDALQTYADSPQSTASAQAAVTAADNLASGLNSASATVQSVREQADAGIASSVSTINSLLTQFGQVNQTIVSGTQSGADVTDALDQRDSVLQQLSTQIGITTVTGANNSVQIYTDSGVTLFDQTAMPVTFTPTPAFTASTQGNAVYADGVPITVPGSSLSIHSGALVGLVS